MSRRRKKKSRKRKGRTPAHLVRFLFKKKHRRSHKKKGRKHMARKKSRGRKRSHRSRRSRSRSRRFSGGGFGFKPSGDDLKLWGATALYGYLEKASGTDKDHLLNKVPRPIDQLGFTGNTALVLWAGSVLLKNRWLRLAARATAGVAMYQFGHRGKLFDQSGERFALTGWDDDDVARAVEAAQIAGVNPYGQGTGF